MTYAVVIQDDTPATQHAARSTAALQALKHVEVTLLLVSRGRQTSRHRRVPDDEVRIRTHRNTTLSTVHHRTRKHSQNVYLHQRQETCLTASFPGQPG